ncbi:MAG: ABC transporter substrate-binding protein, partial [Anaerolineae bacterium]|nr:ABC transporter substrate-binding protein [Anaerolineae bacterium]
MKALVHARIALFVALALLLASCGAPATPAPDLPPTPERATRVPVVMPTEANAD